MPERQTDLLAAEARLVDLWDKMVRTIGIHTVNILMERAIWEASSKHPELRLIEYGDNGLGFDALNKAYAGRSMREVDEAFSDLASELLLILARLLGREMAQRMSQELQAKMPKAKHAEKGRAAAQ